MWRNRRCGLFSFFVLPPISSISICRLFNSPVSLYLFLKKFALKVVTKKKKNTPDVWRAELTYRKFARIIEKKHSRTIYTDSSRSQPPKYVSVYAVLQNAAVSYPLKGAQVLSCVTCSTELSKSNEIFENTLENTDYYIKLNDVHFINQEKSNYIRLRKTYKLQYQLRKFIISLHNKLRAT